MIFLLTRGDSGNHATARAGADTGYCALVVKYKQSLDRTPDKAANAAAASSAVAGYISQAAAAAPPEIKADSELFASAYKQVDDALVAAGPGGSVAPEDLQALSTPELDAALARIAAYDRRVCHIA